MIARLAVDLQLLLAISTFAQEPAPPASGLSDPFIACRSAPALGMEPANPAFDDSGWKTVPLLGSWAEQGYGGFDGALWYRCKVQLAHGPAWQEPAVMVGRLRHGHYEVFADGVPVGAHGGEGNPLPVPRPKVYPIPSERLQQQPLVIALRVWRVGWASDRTSRMLEELRIGEYPLLKDRIELERRRDLMAHLYLLLLAVLFGSFALFHLFLFERRRSRQEYLWFGLSLCAFALNTFASSEWVYEITDSLHLAFRLLESPGHLAAACMIQFLWPLLGARIPPPLRAYQISQLVIGISIAVLPGLEWVIATQGVRFAWLMPLLAASLLLIGSRAWRGNSDARTLALGGACLAVVEVHEFWVMILGFEAWPAVPHPSLGMAGLVIAMTWLLARRFTQSYRQLESARLKLKEQTCDLFREHELFQSVIEGIQEVIYVKDAEGRYRLINSKGAAYLGRSIPEVVGKSESLFMAPKAASRIRRDDLAIMSSGKSMTIEAPLTMGGVTRTFLSTKAPYRDADGKVIGIVGISRDITDRKQAEALLRRHRDDLQQILDSVPIQIIYKDTHNQILRVNRCLAESFGVSPDQMANTPASRWYGELAQEFHREDAQIIRSSAAVVGRTRQIAADGSSRWFRTDKYPRFDEAGQVAGIVVFAQDITEQRRAEKAARQAQQELAGRQEREREEIAAKLEETRSALIAQTRLATIGQVAASLSHELRNPLAVMRNSAYYLRNYPPKLDKKASQHVAYIEQQISIADGIIGNFLLMARNQRALKRPVRLEEMVRTVFAEVSSTRDQAVRLDFGSGVARIWVDPAQMRQVFHNLLLNSCQALEGKGLIRVLAKRAGAWDEIVVRDDGPGIPPQLRESVFEPLISGKVKGTGLGLAICKQIIERHDGTIDLADSKRGTDFRILIPAKEGP